MEAPKCKLCGERHYGLCAVIAKIAESLPEPPPKEYVWAAPATNPKYDRNAAHRAYMKEYMRKRRAKEAGK